MVKKIAIALTLMLFVVLALTIVKEQQIEEENIEQYQEMDQKLRPLNIEKNQIEEELLDLDDRFEAEKMHKATTELLFTEIDARVYTECYPIMQKYGYVGTLAVSHNQLPGMKGNVTVEQFKELLSNGWSICIKWDAGVPVETWWPVLTAELQKFDLGTGQIVYFPIGTYKAELDAKIQELGFQIVAYHTAEVKQLFQAGDQEGLWHLGATGFMENGPKAQLKEAIAQKANIIYLVGFQLDSELYDKNYFSSMMDCFEGYVSTEELMVSTMQKAREHFQGREGVYEQSKVDAYNKEKAALEEKLAEVQAQIDEIKKQYE